MIPRGMSIVVDEITIQKARPPCGNAVRDVHNLSLSALCGTYMLHTPGDFSGGGIGVRVMISQATVPLYAPRW